MLIDGVAWVRYGEEEFIAPTKCQPRYKVGEVVAVAQSYKEIHEKENISPNEIFNRDYYEQTKGWTNKMFVYASLMYHHIRITNVRIERLQDISDEDCLREGVIEDYPGVQYSYPTNIGYCGQYPFSTPRHAFAALIDKVSSKGTWAKNPWVFVYEFELVK
jgi:hypothetical protein